MRESARHVDHQADMSGPGARSLGTTDLVSGPFQELHADMIVLPANQFTEESFALRRVKLEELRHARGILNPDPRPFRGQVENAAIQDTGTALAHEVGPRVRLFPLRFPPLQ